MTANQIRIRTVIGFLCMLIMGAMIWGLTRLKPSAEYVDQNTPEIKVLTPRLEIRSDADHTSLQTWIVTDSKTGCEYMVVKDGPEYRGGPVGLAMTKLAGVTEQCRQT